MRFLSMLFLASVAGHAMADTNLVFDDGSAVLIRQGRVLFGDDENGFLYPGSGSAMTAIEWRNETYMVIDENFTAALSGQMDAAMAQMEAQLAQLPPEQRAMMREMLKNQMPAMSDTASQQRSYKATGKRGEVAGIKCSKGQMLLNGEPEHEVCTASASELGMPDEDYAALRAAFKTMLGLAKEFRRGGDLAIDLESVDGIPISSRQLAGGKGSRLVSVSTAKIAAERLVVPGHFKARDLRSGS